MDQKIKLATLETLGQGVAAELFEAELKKVLANILDPNTKPTETRSITITVSIKPNDARDMANVKIQPRVKLSPINPFDTAIFLKQQGDQMYALVNNVSEQALPFEDEGRPENIVQMAGGK